MTTTAETMNQRKLLLLRVPSGVYLKYTAPFLEAQDIRNLVRAGCSVCMGVFHTYCEDHGTKLSSHGLCKRMLIERVVKDGKDPRIIKKLLAERTAVLDPSLYPQSHRFRSTLQQYPDYAGYLGMLMTCEDCDREAHDRELAESGLYRCRQGSCNTIMPWIQFHHCGRCSSASCMGCNIECNECGNFSCCNTVQFCEYCAVPRCDECETFLRCEHCGVSCCSQCAVVSMTECFICGETFCGTCVHQCARCEGLFCGEHSHCEDCSNPRGLDCDTCHLGHWCACGMGDDLEVETAPTDTVNRIIGDAQRDEADKGNSISIVDMSLSMD